MGAVAVVQHNRMPDDAMHGGSAWALAVLAMRAAHRVAGWHVDRQGL